MGYGMDQFLILGNIGAAATFLLGSLGLVAPAKAAALVSISPLGLNGKSEIRATYGGLFAAMGAFCLISQSTEVFGVASVCWLGAFVGRMISVFIDGNRQLKNIGGCALEASIGLLLMSPTILNQVSV